MSSTPNIIFLHTDQHTWDAVSAYGNRDLATPNIDRLQRNGLSFMRAYCTDPVCAPARSSWMTGRYSSETGVPHNRGVLHDDLPDLGQHLNSHGFPAYHAGKWHIAGREVTASFRTLYVGKRRIGAGGAEYYDGATTRSVVEFLTGPGRREPFFLQIGMVNPHDVCEYGHDFEETLIPDPVAQGILSAGELPPLPANFHYDEPETMTHRVVRRDDDCLIHWPILRRTRRWSELQWRSLAWNLYRFVEKVDAEIGMVLAALEATGRADDTLILFTADHGEAAGRHQMFQKFTLYEESIRVPFIAACLGAGVTLPKEAHDREHFISGVDVFPTVCDYAGVAPPPGLPGRSIRPLLEGGGAAWRGARLHREQLLGARHRHPPLQVRHRVPPDRGRGLSAARTRRGTGRGAALRPGAGSGRDPQPGRRCRAGRRDRRLPAAAGGDRALPGAPAATPRRAARPAGPLGRTAAAALATGGVIRSEEFPAVACASG